MVWKSGSGRRGSTLFVVTAGLVVAAAVGGTVRHGATTVRARDAAPAARSGAELTRAVMLARLARGTAVTSAMRRTIDAHVAALQSTYPEAMTQLASAANRGDRPAVRAVMEAMGRSARQARAGQGSTEGALQPLIYQCWIVCDPTVYYVIAQSSLADANSPLSLDALSNDLVIEAQRTR